MTPSDRPVALVSMPTMATRFPSFQLALLGPVLAGAGFAVRPLSLFLEFAGQIGRAPQRRAGRGLPVHGG